MTQISPVQRARTLLKHLGSAKFKVKEKEQTRIELQEALTKLRSLSTESLKKYIDKVEEKIKELFEKEKKILSQQQKEESVHERLREKLEVLENNINDFLNRSAERKELLEEASRTSLPPPPSFEEADLERIKLQGMLEGIEFMYDSLKDVKGIDKSKLDNIKAQISTLKKKTL